MSYLAAHMEKFKKEAVRGIQGHNQRERKSKSNPDVQSDRSHLNYDLHNDGPVNYATVINQRIDSLNLKKAPRSDAVYMCEVVVTSDEGFFKSFSESQQKRFFMAAKEWLDEFAGRGNTIAAIVHLDEKTPHLHYSHVPVTKDSRLCAKDVYTKESLRDLQNGLAKYLQSRGFDIERGVEQGPGSSKKHLNTREFKQQKEAEKNLRAKVEETALEVQALGTQLEDKMAALQKLETLAQEAEAALGEKPELPKPGLIASKGDYLKALEIIEIQSKALADKKLLRDRNDLLEKERKNIDRLISNAVRESESKAASHYDALKEDSERIQKELASKVNQLQREVSGKEAVIKQLTEHYQQSRKELERLKPIEEKWQAQVRLKQAEAMKAEQKAKAQQPQQQTVRKAPMLQPLSPQQSQPQQQERKNLTPGR